MHVYALNRYACVRIEPLCMCTHVYKPHSYVYSTQAFGAGITFVTLVARVTPPGCHHLYRLRIYKYRSFMCTNASTPRVYEYSIQAFRTSVSVRVLSEYMQTFIVHINEVDFRQLALASTPAPSACRRTNSHFQ